MTVLRLAPLSLLLAACAPTLSADLQPTDPAQLSQVVDCDAYLPSDLLPGDHPCCDEPLWTRAQFGDVNFDGQLDISDVVGIGTVLAYGESDPDVIFVDVLLDDGLISFLADTNGDEVLEQQDMDHLVGWLYLGTHDEPQWFCAAPVESRL